MRTLGPHRYPLSMAMAVVLVVACTSSVTPIPSAAGSPPATVAPTPSMTVHPSPAPTPRPPSATPGPTPTPSPTSTAAPASPSPTATTEPAPGPDSELQAADIEAHLDALADIARDNGGTRASGTAGYDASVDYVAAQLDGLGFEVIRQPVEFTFFRETAPVTLTLGDQSWSGTEWLHAMIYSAGGQVSAGLQAVAIEAGLPTGSAGCEAGEWTGFEPGNVALTFGGPCLRRDAAMAAQEAGAAALITLYPAWGENEIRQPTLLSPAGIDIPIVAAGREPALALLAAADTDAQIELRVEVEMRPATADNVIAELAGSAEGEVMLGGHLDSVLDGPGINDNGSGVATLLATAEALTARPTPAATVRLAFWAVEELGTYGSSHYVEELSPAESAAIAAYINLDMVGSPNAARYVYDNQFAAPGSGALTDALMGALADLGAPGVAIDLGGGSDHAAFERAGIPTGGLFSGALGVLSDEEAELFGGIADAPADPCYHLACDDRTNVDIGAAMTLGQAVLEVVDGLAY